MIRTYKGIWVSANKFICEDGIELEVYPYLYILPKYNRQWPLECYVNINHDGTSNVLTEILSLEPNSSQ